VVYLLLVLYLAAVYLRTFRFKRVAKRSYDLRTLFSPRNGRSLHIFVIFKNNGSLCVRMSYQNTHIWMGCLERLNTFSVYLCIYSLKLHSELFILTWEEAHDHMSYFIVTFILFQLCAKYKTKSRIEMDTLLICCIKWVYISSLYLKTMGVYVCVCLIRILIYEYGNIFLFIMLILTIKMHGSIYHSHSLLYWKGLIFT
jgi:hypothetical protein